MTSSLYSKCFERFAPGFPALFFKCGGGGGVLCNLVSFASICFHLPCSVWVFLSTFPYLCYRAAWHVLSDAEAFWTGLEPWSRLISTDFDFVTTRLRVFSPGLVVLFCFGCFGSAVEDGPWKIQSAQSTCYLDLFGEVLMSRSILGLSWSNFFISFMVWGTSFPWTRIPTILI